MGKLLQINLFLNCRYIHAQPGNHMKKASPKRSLFHLIYCFFFTG